MNALEIMNALERSAYGEAYALLERTGPIKVSYDWADDCLYYGAEQAGIVADTTNQDHITLYVLAFTEDDADEDGVAS